MENDMNTDYYDGLDLNKEMFQIKSSQERRPIISQNPTPSELRVYADALEDWIERDVVYKLRLEEIYEIRKKRREEFAIALRAKYSRLTKAQFDYIMEVVLDNFQDREDMGSVPACRAILWEFENYVGLFENFVQLGRNLKPMPESVKEMNDLELVKEAMHRVKFSQIQTLPANFLALKIADAISEIRAEQEAMTRFPNGFMIDKQTRYRFAALQPVLNKWYYFEAMPLLTEGGWLFPGVVEEAETIGDADCDWDKSLHIFDDSKNEWVAYSDVYHTSNQILEETQPFSDAIPDREDFSVSFDVKYCAMDRNYKWYAYETKPQVEEGEVWVVIDDYGDWEEVENIIPTYTGNWEDSLFEWVPHKGWVQTQQSRSIWKKPTIPNLKTC